MNSELNFSFYDNAEESIKHATDVNPDKNGNHTMALKSCFIACYPNFHEHVVTTLV